MLKKSVVSMLFVFGALMCAANAHAFGFGPYIEFASGSGSFSEAGAQSYMTDDNGDIDVDITGFGIVMDTNLSQNKVLNYRLSLGYDSIEYPDDIDGWRVSIENTFGFGIIKTERLRFWLGPQIHLSYGQMDISNGFDWSDYYDGDDYDYDDYYDDILSDNVSVLGLGIGLVSGVNFNLPGVGSICAELGARYQYNKTDESEGYVEYEETYYYYGEEYSYTDYYWEDTDYTYDETVIFFKLSFMFGK